MKFMKFMKFMKIMKIVKITRISKLTSFVAGNHHHHNLWIESDGLVQCLDVVPGSVVRDLYHLGFGNHHAKTWCNLRHAGDKLLGLRSVLDGADEDPLGAIDD